MENRGEEKVKSNPSYAKKTGGGRHMNLNATME
jgi:hypothetical protein